MRARGLEPLTPTMSRSQVEFAQVLEIPTETLFLNWIYNDFIFLQIPEIVSDFPTNVLSFFSIFSA